MASQEAKEEEGESKTDENTDSNDPQPPKNRVQWIPADQNPWGVPILDVRPATLGLYAVSDPVLARNAVTCGNVDGGKSFATQIPPVDRVLEPPVFPLIYRTSAPSLKEILADGVLFSPTDMAEKWAVFYHNHRLLFVRSWIHEVRVVAHVEPTDDGEHIQITKIVGTFGKDLPAEEEDPMHTCNVIDFLLKQSVLKTPQPAPLPEGMEENVESAADYCMLMYGGEALAAVPFGVRVDPPPSYAQKVLRSISLMHIAVAQDDIETVKTLLEDESTQYMVHCRGRDSTPLFWAVMQLQNPIPMITVLLDGGADMNARTAGGDSTVLHDVCGRRDGRYTTSELVALVEFLLDRGADVLAVDFRGYNALHGAAQTGRLPVLKLLVERGGDVDAISQDEYKCSVKYLAETGGHTEIVAYLEQLSARDGYEAVQ